MAHSGFTVWLFTVVATAASIFVGSSAARVFGALPGYFGNQVCVRQEGLDAKDNASSFILVCQRLDKIKACYDTVVDPKSSPIMDYIGTAFNVSKLTSVYTAMCDKLKAYASKNGHASLILLDSNTLRKQVYFKAFMRASVMAQKYNASAEYVETVCRSAVVWTNKAESTVAGDKMEALRQIMNETNWNSLSDRCHKLFAPKNADPSVFPSVLGIPLAKPARLCMNRSVSEFSYLYDDKIKCVTKDKTYWPRHLSCKRADEMLDCTNRFLIQGSFMPKSVTYMAQFLFDLDKQKKAFRSYCASPRAVRNLLQCLPMEAVNAAMADCLTPWITQVTSLLGGNRKNGLKKDVCKKTIARIACEKDILSGVAPKAAKLYAKLQTDGLPPICNVVNTGKSRVTYKPTMTKTTTTKNSASRTACSRIVVLSLLLAVSVGSVMRN